MDAFLMPHQCKNTTNIQKVTKILSDYRIFTGIYNQMNIGVKLQIVLK